jgi:hypothetical protein
MLILYPPKKLQKGTEKCMRIKVQKLNSCSPFQFQFIWGIFFLHISQSSTEQLKMEKAYTFLKFCCMIQNPSHV